MENLPHYTLSHGDMEDKYGTLLYQTARLKSPFEKLKWYYRSPSIFCLPDVQLAGQDALLEICVNFLPSQNQVVTVLAL